MVSKHLFIPAFLCSLLAVSPVLLAEAESESADDGRDRVRRYDKRIQLYDVDLGRSVPQRDYDEESSLGSSIGSREESLIDSSPTPMNYNRPPVQKNRDDTQRKKNWILPPMSDDLKGASSDTQERETSGWGWLADEVESRETSKAKELARDNEDRAHRERNRGDKKEVSRDSYRLDSAFEPVATDSLFESIELDEPRGTSQRGGRDAEEEAVKKALEEQRRDDSWKLSDSADDASGPSERSGGWLPSIAKDPPDAGAQRLSRTEKLLSGIATPDREPNEATRGFRSTGQGFSSSASGSSYSPSSSRSTAFGSPTAVSSYDQGGLFSVSVLGSDGSRPGSSSTRPAQEWQTSPGLQGSSYDSGSALGSLGGRFDTQPSSTLPGSSLRGSQDGSAGESLNSYQTFERPDDSGLKLLPW